MNISAVDQSIKNLIEIKYAMNEWASIALKENEHINIEHNRVIRCTIDENMPWMIWIHLIYLCQSLNQVVLFLPTQVNMRNVQSHHLYHHGMLINVINVIIVHLYVLMQLFDHFY